MDEKSSGRAVWEWPFPLAGLRAQCTTGVRRMLLWRVPGTDSQVELPNLMTVATLFGNQHLAA
jgi:hypothetical protein